MPASSNSDTHYTLVIGNKNLSSWSLRPWILMRHAGIPFDEIKIMLDQPDTEALIRAHSAAGKVPVLYAGDLVIWDSLAICEYLAECHPEKALWPATPEARTMARSVSAEMHAGFSTLREELPMNICGSYPGRTLSPRTAGDIDRITAIWRDCRAKYGGEGPFLFGTFSVADAMFAPVITRFETYGVAVGAVEQAYCDTIHALPAMEAWRRDAQAEVMNETVAI